MKREREKQFNTTNFFFLEELLFFIYLDERMSFLKKILALAYPLWVLKKRNIIRVLALRV